MSEALPRPDVSYRDHRLTAEAYDPNVDLTLKQWKFVRHFAAHGIGTDAAVAAGYSQKSASPQASSLLAMDKIRTAIDRELADSASRCAITTDSVLRGLVRESTYAGSGASHAARVRALELLGKTLSMFVDQSQIIGSDGKPVDRFAPVVLQIIRNG